MVFVNIAVQLGYKENWLIFGLVIFVTVISAFLSTEIIGGLSRIYREKSMMRALS